MFHRITKSAEMNKAVDPFERTAREKINIAQLGFAGFIVLINETSMSWELEQGEADGGFGFRIVTWINPQSPAKAVCCKPTSVTSRVLSEIVSILPIL